MDEVFDSEPMADFFDTKQNLTQSIAELCKEIDDVKSKMNNQKVELSAMQRERGDLLIEDAKLDMALLKNQVELNYKLGCQKQLNHIIDDAEKHVHDQSLLKSFEEEAAELRNAMQSAMAFYSDESLQMELVKVGNTLREKRVEYTKLDQAYKDLKERIEQEKRERERLKQIEEERRLQEAEMKRKEAEMIKRLEEERQIKETSINEQKRLSSPNDMNKLPFLGGFNFFKRPTSTRETVSCSDQSSSGSTQPKTVRFDKKIQLEPSDKIGQSKDFLGESSTNFSQIANFFS